MRKILPALLLLFAPLALAQNQTAVTGTLTDPNTVPYYPAKVTACLTPSTLNPTVGGQPVNPNPGTNYCVGPVNTAPSGFFSMGLYANANIVPASTQWVFTVTTPGVSPPAGTGALNFSATITISGASQDVGATLKAAGTAQLNSGGGTAGVGSMALPATTSLIAYNQFLDGSGTIMSDSSGVGTNTCTLAGGGAAPTVNTVANGGGLTFLGTSNQFCSYPAALNAARTFIVALSFQPFAPTNLLAAANPGSFFSPQIIAGNDLKTDSIALSLVDSFSSVTASNASQGAFQLQSMGTTNNTPISSTVCYFQGTGVLAFTLSAPDSFYINGQLCPAFQSGTTAVQSGGNYQLGGSGTTPFSQKNFTGTMYCFAAWNVVLTAPQVAQATQALQSSCLTQRGVTPVLGAASVGPQNWVSVVDGDSLTSATNWPTQGLNPAFGLASNVAMSGTGLVAMTSRANISADPLINPFAQNNVITLWGGTNNAGVNFQQAASYEASYCRARKLLGWKCIIATMVSRFSEDVFKDNYNPLTRQLVPLYADGLVDFAANPHLGCDNCFSNTTYFNGDQIHLTPFSDQQIVGPYFIHAINRATGNFVNSGTFNIYTGTGFSVPQVLQYVDCIIPGATSVQCVFPWPESTGSLLVAVENCIGCAATTLNVPTDSAANTWNALQATSNYSSTGQLRAFYAANAVAGANTVTLTNNAGAPNQVLVTMAEICCTATVTPLDVQSIIATGTSTAPATANVTTTATGDVLIGYGALFANGGQNPPYSQWWTPGTGYLDWNNMLSVFGETKIAGAAGSYGSNASLLYSFSWGSGLAAFKAVAGTSTYFLQDSDVYAECSPNGTNNVALTLPDGTWMSGGTVTIKNNQTSGAATCVVNAPTPYQTGVQQTIDGATSVTIANKATAVFKSKYSFTGTAGTNLVPVITWEQLQNN